MMRSLASDARLARHSLPAVVPAAMALLCLFPLSSAAEGGYRNPGDTSASPREASVDSPPPPALVVRLAYHDEMPVRLAAVRQRVGLTTEEHAFLVTLCARELDSDACLAWLSRFSGLPRIVSVPEFWLDRTEATVAEYRNCMSLVACPRVPDPALDLPAAERLPIAFVTRDAARAYCQFKGGRLPTTVEFERAARGRASNLFPWGNLYHSLASNHGRFALGPMDADDGYFERAPVGALSSGSTREGICDLSGNVSEWTEDGEESFEPSAPNTVGSICGGSFASGSVGLVGSACTTVAAATHRADIGFRCAYDEPRAARATDDGIAPTH